jgi:hypothetical protein
MKNNKNVIKKGVLMNNPNLHIMPERTRTKEIAKEKTTLVMNQLNQKAEFCKPIISKL